MTMRKKRTTTWIGLCLLCGLVMVIAFTLTACREDSTLTKAEIEAAAEFTEHTDILKDVTQSLLTPEVAEENAAVKKIYTTEEGDYLFFCAPVGYNGPIDFLLVIDDETRKTKALRIINHLETEEYVRDMESPWFVDRFADKSVNTYLERVKLEAAKDEQIVAITGSTVTTDAMVAGVNDAFCVYRGIKAERKEAQNEERQGVLICEASGKELANISLEQLKTLESYRRKLVIHSSTGDTTHDFRGVRLSEVIDLADPELLKEYSIISAVGSDGYAADLTREEVLQENNVYLMYEDFDQPIETADGQQGGLRLVILKDDYGQRFTNFLEELQLKKE